MDCIGGYWGHKELDTTEQLFTIPSLMSSCLNLPFGTQRKSRSLNEAISYKLETKTWEGFVSRRAPQALAQ